MNIAEKSIIRHAVGAVIDVPKREHGYRNHYCVSVNSPDIEVLNGLVSKGFMKKGRLINDGHDQYFHVTELGCEAIGLKKSVIKRIFEP
jgi:hypothetical protein